MPLREALWEGVVIVAYHVYAALHHAWEALTHK